MAKEHYKDMGAYLKDCREGLGYKLDDVSKQLNIRERYLKAIEEGNFDNLPGAIYTEGYLKNYAKYLKLDPKEVLEMYRKGGANDDTKVEETFMLPEPYSDGLRPNAMMMIGAAVAVAIIYGFWYFSHQDEATEQVADEETTIQTEGSLTEDDLTVIGVMSGRVGVDAVENKEVLHSMDQDSNYSLPGDSDQPKAEDITAMEEAAKAAKAKKAAAENETLGWKTAAPAATAPVEKAPEAKKEQKSNFEYKYPRAR